MEGPTLLRFSKQKKTSPVDSNKNVLGLKERKGKNDLRSCNPSGIGKGSWANPEERGEVWKSSVKERVSNNKWGVIWFPVWGCGTSRKKG